MTRPHVLAGLGGGLLAAVFAGVTIGNATVDGINPIHYRAAPSPRPRPVAIREPAADMLARRQPTYEELYSWEAGEMARPLACEGDCEGSYSAQIPYFNSREELAAAQNEARRAIDRAFAAESEAAMDRKGRARDSRWTEDKDEPGFVEETIAVGDSGYSE